MSNNKILAQHAVITVADSMGSPITLGGFKGITNLDGGSAKKIDSTNMASDAKEWDFGLPDGGAPQISVTRDFADPGQQEIKSMSNLQAKRQFVVTYSDSSTQTFTAGVVSFSTDANSDDILMGKITLQVSGVVVEG